MHTAKLRCKTALQGFGWSRMPTNTGMIPNFVMGAKLLHKTESLLNHQFCDSPNRAPV